MCNKIKIVILTFVFFLCCSCTTLNNKSQLSSPHKNLHEDESFSIALAGDWDDFWGEEPESKTRTRDSLVATQEHDLVVLLGDLSYGRDKLDNIAQAERWCDRAKKYSNNRPMIFVPGDHDSKAQDGDIDTYVDCLTQPTGIISTPQTKGYGQYPYLYYVDVIRDDVKLRIVATSIAYQEEEHEPDNVQHYFSSYAKGSTNYHWLKTVYTEARNNNFWVIHINHLPCIDMGKNQSFGVQCEDVVNLNIETGVNVMLTGSSHNIWRTRLLSHSDTCKSVPLTTKPDGANPACALQGDHHIFKDGAGLIQAHAGAGGKLKASKRAKACDAETDGEALHYLADGACGINNVPGFVSMTFNNKTLSAEYYLSQEQKIFRPYTFSFVRE